MLLCTSMLVVKSRSHCGMQFQWLYRMGCLKQKAGTIQMYWLLLASSEALLRELSCAVWVCNLHNNHIRVNFPIPSCFLFFWNWLGYLGTHFHWSICLCLPNADIKCVHHQQPACTFLEHQSVWLKMCVKPTLSSSAKGNRNHIAVCKATRYRETQKRLFTPRGLLQMNQRPALMHLIHYWKGRMHTHQQDWLVP